MPPTPPHPPVGHVDVPHDQASYPPQSSMSRLSVRSTAPHTNHLTPSDCHVVLDKASRTRHPRCSVANKPSATRAALHSDQLIVANCVEHRFAELTTKKLRRGTHTRCGNSTLTSALDGARERQPQALCLDKTDDQILQSVDQHCKPTKRLATLPGCATKVSGNRQSRHRTFAPARAAYSSAAAPADPPSTTSTSQSVSAMPPSYVTCC